MDINEIREIVSIVAGMATVILLLIAMGRANNGSWGPPVLLFLAGMCALVFGSYSQLVIVELSLPAAGILFFTSGVALTTLLTVAAKDHEWLAILGGFVCCLMLAQCANRLLPIPF